MRSATLSIGLTAKEAVQVEIICENASNVSVFFDNLSVKVQAVPTVIVVQENHYYPFGLGMKGLDWVLPNGKEDKYSFQSKEKQTDFDLNLSDFEARSFDYQTDRTTTIDPHAENYYSLSPYSFLGNNPLFFTDPTGKDIIVKAQDSEQERWEYLRKLYETTVSAAFNDKVTASVDDKTGKVSFSINKGAKLDKYQSAAFKSLNDIATDANITVTYR